MGHRIVQKPFRVCARRVVLSSGAGIITVLLNHTLTQADQAAIHSSMLSSRHLGTLSQRCTQAPQPTTSSLDNASGSPQQATSTFAEEVIREIASAPLAQLLAVLNFRLRELLAAHPQSIKQQSIVGTELRHVKVLQSATGCSATG